MVGYVVFVCAAVKTGADCVVSVRISAESSSLNSGVILTFILVIVILIHPMGLLMIPFPAGRTQKGEQHEIARKGREKDSNRTAGCLYVGIKPGLGWL